MAFALAVAAVMALAPAEAPSSHVSCGDTITADTTLDGDLDCGDISGAGDAALTIGADAITLDLNGHLVSATCASDCAGTAVLVDGAGYNGVGIVYGRIEANDVAAAVAPMGH